MEHWGSLVRQWALCGGKRQSKENLGMYPGEPPGHISQRLHQKTAEVNVPPGSWERHSLGLSPEGGGQDRWEAVGQDLHRMRGGVLKQVGFVFNRTSGGPGLPTFCSTLATESLDSQATPDMQAHYFIPYILSKKSANDRIWEEISNSGKKAF